MRTPRKLMSRDSGTPARFAGSQDRKGSSRLAGSSAQCAAANGWLPGQISGSDCEERPRRNGRRSSHPLKASSSARTPQSYARRKGSVGLTRPMSFRGEKGKKTHTSCFRWWPPIHAGSKLLHYVTVKVRPQWKLQSDGANQAAAKARGPGAPSLWGFAIIRETNCA